MSRAPKYLFLFDFDDTVIDGNSDSVIWDLFKGEFKGDLGLKGIYSKVSFGASLHMVHEHPRDY